MFAKTACILISGRINSGKTTFAKLIEEELSYMDNMKNRGYYVASFATQLKYIAKNYFGWDGNKDTKGRKLLQVLGTDAGREYNEDLWVSTLIDKIVPNLPFYPLDFLIIDDWRFPNETSYIEKDSLYSVYRIRLIGSRLEEIDRHISESSLPENDINYYFDIIFNNGSIDDLRIRTKNFIKDILAVHPMYGKEI